MSGVKNGVDKKFYELIKLVNESGYDGLCDLMKHYVNKLNGHNLYDYMILSYNAPENEGFWGKINPKENVYELIENRARTLIHHMKDFEWLYEELGDYRSKNVLYSILANWITFNWEYLSEVREKQFKDYFDLDLIPEISENEIFVDLGGYVGDTIVDFIDTYGEMYDQIISYEVDSDNYSKMEMNTERFIGIDLRKKGAGSENGTMYIKPEGSTTKVADSGENAVDIVRLDDDILYPFTWLKMDIEGAEKDAIEGARNHITNEKPKLTICTYHSNDDIWEIPRVIKDLNSDYKLYMRYYGGENSLYPCEYVLYAL